MNEDGEPVDPEQEEAWSVLALRLGAFLSTMGGDDALTLHLPAGSGEASTLIVTRSPEQASVAMRSAEWGELEMDEVDSVSGLPGFALALVELLRDECDVPHPSLLTVSAAGGCASALGVLRLTEHGDVGADSVADPDEDRRVSWYADADQLRAAVVSHVREKVDDEAFELDEDGDGHLEVNGEALWIRVLGEQPTLLVFAPVVRDVHSRRQADAELNILNRDSVWMRWARRDRTVWQELVVPLRPFVPRMVDQLITGFAVTLRETRQDLTDRLHGEARR